MKETRLIFIFLSTKKVDNPILKKRPGNPYDGCIALGYYGYFDHGLHVGRLPKKDWIFITNWLSNNTNYKYACELWNMSNGNYTIELPKDPNDIDFNPYK